MKYLWFIGVLLLTACNYAQAQLMPQDSWAFQCKWGANGTANGQFTSLSGLDVAADGRVFVADSGNYRIQVFEANGTFVRKWGSYGTLDGQFKTPSDVAVAPNGRVFVADSDNHRIQVFEADGTFVSKWVKGGEPGSSLGYPQGVAVASDGLVFVSDSINYRIQVFDADGTFVSKWVSFGTDDGQFLYLSGVAVTPDGQVVVADTVNMRIQVFSKAAYRLANGTFKLGKKPYPQGTRELWIAGGRVLAGAPDGYLPQNKMLKSAVNNSGNLPPIGDQGNENSCVYWAGTYYTKTASMKRNNPLLDITAASNQCSPRFTYNLTNCGVDGGGYGHEPFEIFMRYGVASLQQAPYIATQYINLPVAADFIEGLHRHSINYVWLWQWKPTVNQLAELKTLLAAGGVAACAIKADASFANLTKGSPPWIGPSCGYYDLNHLVTVCGYSSNSYLIANSWGESWGSNGFININASYFENYIGDVMYPLEPPAYPPATNYATLKITHARRSDIQSLAFIVNGVTIWNNSPLLKDLPNGLGLFKTDNRANWELAVDLSSAAWGPDNTVTAKCMDNVTVFPGSISNFTLRLNGANYFSTNTPIAIPDNTGVPASAMLRAVTRTTNGTPCSWLEQYYPGTNNYDNADMSDSDHDGLAAWQEYIAGTIPTSEASTFKILEVISDASTEIIRWLAASGRFYSVWCMTNLFSGWDRVATNLAAPVNVYTNRAPKTAERFYMLDVNFP